MVRRHIISGRMRPACQGFSVWSLALYLFLMGAGLVLVLRILPGYFEYMAVKDLIIRAAAEHDARSETIPDLRLRLSKLLTTNQIYDTTIDDIRIYRERGLIVIDANYEKRFALIWILDGVMKFDDLVVETAPAERN